MNFVDKFRSKPANVPKPKRMPRSTEPFVKTTLSQAERLFQLKPVCWPLFTFLLFESFRCRGRPFTLPINELDTLKGLRQTNTRAALRQLEACGLISVLRQPPKPPEITVLSVTT